MFLSIRVFLRAINTYADTMNQKFLNNNDFEVQVSVFVRNYSQWKHLLYSRVHFSRAHYNTYISPLLFLVVE